MTTHAAMGVRDTITSDSIREDIQRKQHQRGKLQNGADRDHVDHERERPPPESAARKLDAVCQVRQVQTLRTRFGGSGNRSSATAGPVAILPRSG